MHPEPLRDREKRHGKRVMSDYCVSGPVVVAEDVSVASGIHFHSERFLSSPPALIPD